MQIFPVSSPLFARAAAVGLVLLTGVSPLLAADGDQEKATKLADAVLKACGGADWSGVKRVQFTFQVEQPGKAEPLASVKHDWDVAANKDTVQWGGKTVTVDLSAANKEGDAKAGFQRWTNDAYWMMAPLKLKDPGVKLTYKGKQMMDGKECEVLHVAFDKVGLTNNDQYNWYIDPATSMPIAWDYMPAPGKSVHGTWTDYQESGGIKISTDHQFGDKRIRILGLQVER